MARGVQSELVHIETQGDLRRDVSLDELGGQGVFAVEIQRAVLDGAAVASGAGMVARSRRHHSPVIELGLLRSAGEGSVVISAVHSYLAGAKTS